MRTFLAVDISEEIRAGITELLNGFLRTDPGIKWVDPGLMHITLFFFGEVDRQTLEKLEAITGETVQQSGRFTVSVGGLGAFPTLEAPRVIWTGVKNDTGELGDIYCGIRDRILAERLPVKTEKRDYRPHITIGRVKSRPERRLLELIEAKKEEQFGICEARGLALYQSTLTRRGPVYRILREFMF
jgi:2'-5' RNA ligase